MCELSQAYRTNLLETAESQYHFFFAKKINEKRLKSVPLSYEEVNL